MFQKEVVKILSILIIPVFVCCASTKEVDEYADWKKRNNQHLSEIAALTATFEQRNITKDNAVKGDMFRLRSFRLDSTTALSFPANDYIYCTVLEDNPDKDSGGSPLYTDSVWIHYRGRLIPTEQHPNGFIFDQSFKTETLEEDINEPGAFVNSGLVVGMITALQEMHVGDYWRIYIPYNLGYDNVEKSNIPIYSNLVFDVKLVHFSYRIE